MRTKVGLLLSCLVLLLFACKVQEQKIATPFPDDGTSVFYDQNKKPFYHGVASGDPLSNSVILWTRVTPENISKVTVKWTISTNADMSGDKKSGTITTDAAKDYTVKVDVRNLQPNTTFYYQFEALGEKSVIGRTKTAGENDFEAVKLAVVSCSNYEAGYYNAFARIAERDDLNAVVHLGDYIYEYEPDGYSDPTLDRKHLPAKEIVSLADYRTRYSQYRLDKDFQKVHQMHPFITIWDDHEVANNVYTEGAQNHQPEDGDFMTRKEAAKQAYFEWLPVRDNATRDIYRTFSFGNTVDLIMLDERLAGRTYPVDSMKQAEFNAENRTMLGAKQLDWFKNELTTSDAIWKVIGNQVIFSPVDIGGLGWGSSINLDAWDGYPYERNQISQFLEKNKIENLIITTGDTHSSWAFEVPAADKKSAIAVEFGTPSITSSNSDESAPTEKVKQAEQVIMAQNPHLKYTDLRNHGYLILDLTKDKTTAEWYYVDKLNVPSDGERLGKQYEVKSGVNVLN
ncbi:MAG: alkaline phosphatase D family protein [Bacteroidota bacterium]